MKKSALILIISWISLLQAAWLTNQPVFLTQPDGKKLDLLASGDEYNNWLHDKQLYTVMQAENGYYVYAKQERGALVPSNWVVGECDPTTLPIHPNLRVSAKVMTDRRNARLFELTRNTDGTRAPSTGTLNNIVVFIRFADQSEFTTTLSTYQSMFNATTGNSLQNYFKEASYNQLTISSSFYPTQSGTTVVSYRDSHNRGYFSPYNATTNTIGYQDDATHTAREHTMLKSAIESIASSVPSSLTIDGDGDGKVDNVCFIIQGGSDGWSDLLWPHRWSLYSYTVNINGKRVYDYNLQLATYLNSSGVGVLCHEMFHSLGAPDLYHYTDNDITPAGGWDLMEANANPPEHMTAYMKFRYGNWISSIPVISTAGTYTLNPITSSSGQCYKIASPYSSTEYFVVEYRRKTGTFENSVPGSGLIAYRINTAADGDGNASGPPDELYIFRPGGTPTVDGSISNAYFSSESGRTSISSVTDPYPFLANGSAGGLSLNTIGSAGATISFNVAINNISLPAPTSLTAIVSGSSVNLSWTSPAYFTSRWIQWGTDNNAASLGASGGGQSQFIGAVRFASTDLTNVAGQYLTKVSFYPSISGASYTIKVWRNGSSTSPGTQVISQAVSTYTAGTMNTVTLSSPVQIISGQELWFGVDASTASGFSLGMDAGPAIVGKGDMLKWGSSSWTTLATNHSINRNWNLKGYVEDIRATVPALEPILELSSHYTNSGIPEVQENTLALDTASPQNYSNDRGLNQFKIYRDNTYLGVVSVGTTTYTDSSPGFGTHNYYVTSIFSGGESLPSNVASVTVNDGNDTAASATLLTLNATNLTMGVDYVGDVDWYRFYLTKASTVFLYTEKPTSSSLDPKAWLYGPYLSNGSNLVATAYIASDDDGNSNLQPKIKYTVTQSGWYFLRISYYNNAPTSSNESKGGVRATTGGYNLFVYALAAPNSFRVTNNVTSASISWLAPSFAPDSYKLYRNGTLIANPTTNSYMDATAPHGIALAYSVASVYTSPSGESGNTDAITTYILDAPATVLVQSDSTAITLSWTTVDAAVSYKIYAASSQGGEFTQIGSTTSTSFQIPLPVSDRLKYFRVTAFR